MKSKLAKKKSKKFQKNETQNHTENVTSKKNYDFSKKIRGTTKIVAFMINLPSALLMFSKANGCYLNRFKKVNRESKTLNI